MADVADGELAHGPGTQAYAAKAQFVLAADRLHRVAHDVQHRLNHLFAVDQHVGDAWVVITHQGDAALAFRFDQLADALQHFMNVAHRQRRQFVRAEHAVDQIAQAVGFFNDHVGVIAQTFFRQFAGQQLRGAADATERILDLVSEAAYQHLAGFLLGQLRLLLGDPQQAVTRMDLQQEHGRAIAEDWRHRVIHGQRLASEGGKHRLALGERMRLLHCLAQGIERLGGFGEQLADELSMAALPADGEEHLRRRVHVLKAQFGVEQDGGGGQVVEQQTVDCVANSHQSLFWGRSVRK
ncbi:hypothetical protein D3C73_346490 [compost metagenome]